MCGDVAYGQFKGVPIFKTFNCRDEGGHDGVGRSPGAQPRNDIGVIRIENQHVVWVPVCEQMHGNEGCKEFEPCDWDVREGFPTWAPPDERQEPSMREREELIAMDAAAAP